MYCLRCGRETDDEQAFCLDCQKEMAKYPVDPNAVVLLPKRNQGTPKKQPKRRPSPEDQVHALRKKVRLLACLLAAAVIAVACLTVSLVRLVKQDKQQIGQNYSTVKTDAQPTETIQMIP